MKDISSKGQWINTVNNASNTMLIHHASGSMMAVLQEMQDNGNCPHDEALQYLFFLLSKMALNTLVLSFWLQSITKSFIGILSISMYLVDLLMICTISWIYSFRENLEAHKFLCFSLSHSSTVYSVLPLPVLLAGALDYAAHRHLVVSWDSPGRTAGRCIVVLLMWALACCYSYMYTSAELLTIQYKEEMQALVCPVQDSTVVSYFNLNLFIAAGAILLLYCRGVPRWARLANKLSSKRGWLLAPKSDLAFFNTPQKLKEGTTEDPRMDQDRQDLPPLFVSLTLCFILNWTPYLLMSVTCDLLGFAVPAYATVNLLWTACANSLLAGVAFWYSSDDLRPFCKLPDDICTWSFYWHLSKENYPASKMCHNRLSTLSEKLLYQL
ncbi:probable G-protein coupled receptor 160 isoform X1 [Pygocentrus nattereri]|uniref:probable G-protein coupled receptor 160 isoform X1 n=2 Tax=Pygocentrus nattereri TaxID=42514 RepID=UPI001890E781|nr:probable G-protein coupled receptor 160 isoform X1 [Pygocentrus nattereri]XP_037392074.1 probable G-protein coupled receptor 160 isoform X1 [Pygocentrus nattereri]